MLDLRVKCGQIDVIFYQDDQGWRLTTFSMIDGELLPGGWTSDPVDERADLVAWVGLIVEMHPEVRVRTWDISDGTLRRLNTYD